MIFFTGSGSDISALHISIGQSTGLITFHGPNLQDGFGKPDDMPPANESALWQVLTHSTSKPPSADGGFSLDFTDVRPLELRAINPGGATGPFIGGNLAVLCGLMGTPYEIPTAGRILFLEDVSERAYRIDASKDFAPILTFGGLLTNTDAQVLHASGEVIPGLYAAGRTVNGIPGAPYMASGLSVGDSSFFGRCAGRHLTGRA